MKNHRNAPYFLDFGGIKIKVYQAGSSPAIQKADTATVPRRIHTHFTYEIFFVTAGQLDVSIGEDSFIFENCVLIVPPHLKHCASPASDGNYCLLFSFEDTATDPIRPLPEEGFLHFPITEELSFYIRTLNSKVHLDTKTAKQDREHLTALIFSAVLTELLPENKTAPSLGAPKAHISAIEDFINIHYHKKITLSDVAQHVYLSTKQVSRIIEREYGMGFSELIAVKRLDSAAVLLVSTDQSISQIAAEVFPDSPTYFYTLFKRKYGMSPLNYRKSSHLRQKSE